MKRLGLALLYAIGGCVVAAVASYHLINEFSTNPRDRALGAAMTSAVV